MPVLAGFQWCFLAVIVSIPISVKLKSYWPLALLGSIGSIADYTTGYVEAFPLKQELVKLRNEQAKGAVSPVPPTTHAASTSGDGQGTGTAQASSPWPHSGECDGDAPQI